MVADNEESLLPWEKIKRRVVVKKESLSSPDYGSRPEERAVEELLNYGIVNIDKPPGPTSHQVAEYVKRIMGISKAGHSGTLDPGVTGCLPVTLMRATRVNELLLSAGKEYIALMHVHSDYSLSKIEKVAKKFTGRIRQLPPVKSAVKRRLRYRDVYYLRIIEKQGRDVLLRAGVEAGTYMRKLIHDMGVALGSGAHMVQLRRTKAGPFNESTLFTLQDLADALYYLKEGNESFIRRVVQPVEAAVVHLPKVWVLDSAVEAICHGVDLAMPGISMFNDPIEKDQVVAVMTLKNELVATGRALVSGREMNAEHGLAVFIDKVFMQPGTYPKQAINQP